MTSPFFDHAVEVSAPGTSANLGPGFDSFGLSLAWYDVVTARVMSDGLAIDVKGEGADLVPRDESHLVVRALRATLDHLGLPQPGLALKAHNVLPHGRGLGSSAAAIVAGIRLADALAGSHLTAADLLSLATDIEGHPDNVAACLFGGFTIAWSETGIPKVARFDVHHDVRATVFVPPTPLSTELARGLLPPTLPHADASANSARAGLLAAAMTRAPEYLLSATEDRLHQSFRRPAMEPSLQLVDGLRAAGVAAVVSGAGPTVLVLSTTPVSEGTRGMLPDGWRTVSPGLDPAGATVRLV